MFYYIKGNLAHKGENFVVIDAGGVGYKVYTSLATLSKSSVDTLITVYTYLHIREDIMDIYGFLTEDELHFFEILISVSGVGPKAGLAILSTLSPSELITAIVTGDAKVITKAPGVGIKIAQRVVLELKDKLKDKEVSEAIGADSGTYVESSGSSEAVNALIVLGYSGQEARRAVSAVNGEINDVEDIIKEALKQLMK